MQNSSKLRLDISVGFSQHSTFISEMIFRTDKPDKIIDILLFYMTVHADAYIGTSDEKVATAL